MKLVGIVYLILGVFTAMYIDGDGFNEKPDQSLCLYLAIGHVVLGGLMWFGWKQAKKDEEQKFFGMSGHGWLLFTGLSYVVGVGAALFVEHAA